MSHEKRLWYIESLNDKTNRWVFENLSIDRDAGIVIDAPVEIEKDGKRAVITKNLVEVTRNDITTLGEHEESIGLSFEVFMRESRGAKIQPWIMNLRRE